MGSLVESRYHPSDFSFLPQFRPTKPYDTYWGGYRGESRFYCPRRKVKFFEMTIAATRVIKENFTSILGQFNSTMTSPVCLRADVEGSAQVLCPETNGARHCAIAIHLYILPRAYYMSLCVPG